MKRSLIVLLLLTLSLAQAQVIRNFTSRYSTNTTGDIVLIGNTLMTCSPTGTNGGQCASARNGTTSGRLGQQQLLHHDLRGHRRR
ncbi:MAG: hypothetical protein KatS3mg072_0533 [Meiothermus sp.]|nr:MAG: hypothetical protein KatS3mg072_0533 [Meiothermus sp.]